MASSLIIDISEFAKLNTDYDRIYADFENGFQEFIPAGGRGKIGKRDLEFSNIPDKKIGEPCINFKENVNGAYTKYPKDTSNLYLDELKDKDKDGFILVYFSALWEAATSNANGHVRDEAKEKLGKFGADIKTGIEASDKVEDSKKPEPKPIHRPSDIADTIAHTHKDYLRYNEDREYWMFYNGVRWPVDSGEIRLTAYIRDTIEALQKDFRDYIVNELKDISDKPLTDEKENDSEYVRKWWLKKNLKFAISKLDNIQSRAAYGNIKMFLKSLLLITEEQFDTHYDWLNCPENTVDLMTDETFEHNPEHFFTQVTRGQYIKGKTHEMWDSSVKYALPDKKIRDYEQRYHGYATTGRATEKAFKLSYGDGDTLKSTIKNAIEESMGDYAVVSGYDAFKKDINRDPSKPSEHIRRLKKARYVLINEIPKGLVLDDAFMKSFSSGEKRNTRGLYERNSEDQKARYKAEMVGNYKPLIDYEDNAQWNRIQITKYGHKITEDMRDNAFLDKLVANQDVLDAIITWLVEGAVQWNEQGLNPPVEVLQEKAKYQREMNPAYQWYEDCIRHVEYDKDMSNIPKALRQKESVGEMFKSFCDWRRAVGDTSKPINIQTFARYVVKLGLEGWRDTSTKMYYYLDVEILEPYEKILYDADKAKEIISSDIPENTESIEPSNHDRANSNNGYMTSFSSTSSSNKELESTWLNGSINQENKMICKNQDNHKL